MTERISCPSRQCSAIVAGFILALTCAASVHAAAPLADKVPGDALIYIGWAGADSQMPAYQASDLGAFIDHSNLPELAKQYLPHFWENMGFQGPDKAVAAGLQKALPLLWRHPTALFEPNIAIDPDGPQPSANIFNISLEMVCDAGDDAAELQTDLLPLIKANKRLRLDTQGSIVTVRSVKVTDANSPSTLAQNPAFIASMQKLQSSPSLAVYVDAKAMLARVDDAVKSDDDAAATWPKVRDALGIGTVETFAMTAGFDGSNWMTQSLLKAPSPRTGLLAVFEPQPIDPALLARIPATAGSVSVYNFDLAKFVDTIGNAMAVTPQSDQAFHQINGVATVGLGANFRRKIVGPLGPQWVLYSDSQLHSAVLLNHPNDPATAKDSMVSAVFGLVNVANAQIPGAATQPVANAVQSTIQKVDVTTAETKYASPSVAVNDGVLYFGFSPESLVTAATLPSSPPATNLIHSEGFASTVKRLGVSDFASFEYCDLPSTAPRAYDSFGPAGAQLREAMKMLGVELPKIELPPLDDVKAHLSPALSVRWANSDGIYSKSISPFPLSTHLLGDPQQTMVSASAIKAISAMLTPVIQRSRAQALSVQMMSDERQILMAMQMYAADHQGALPPDLGSLVKDGQIDGPTLHIFLSPMSKTTVPDTILTGTKDQQGDWVNANSQYELLTPGKNLSDLGPANETIVLVPKDAAHATARVGVGYADGHVETATPRHLQHLLHPDG